MNKGWFKKGKRNNQKGEFKKGHIPKNYINIESELLESLYLGNQYPVDKISKIFNISKVNIYKKFKKFNIPIRERDRNNVDNGITLCRECHMWIHYLNPLDFQ